MTQTFLALAARLPAQLANIAHLYIWPNSLEPEAIGASGYFELCTMFPVGSVYSKIVLDQACCFGYDLIVLHLFNNMAPVDLLCLKELAKWPGALDAIDYIYSRVPMPELFAEACIDAGLAVGDYGYVGRRYGELPYLDQDRFLLDLLRDGRIAEACGIINAYYAKRKPARP